MTHAAAETLQSSVASDLVAVRDLARADRAAMHGLLDRHFAGVSREQFDHDLAGKNWVLLLRDGASGALAGFSTMCVYETRVSGSPVSVVCSGDTIVDHTLQPISRNAPVSRAGPSMMTPAMPFFAAKVPATSPQSAP